MKSNEKFNATLGMFQLPMLDLFSLGADSKYQPTVKSLKLFLNTLESIANWEYKIAENGQLGEFDGSKYTSGVLGMMTRKEIDVIVFPLTIDIHEPPGKFSSVVIDEQFLITSYPRDINQFSVEDVTLAFDSIDWITKMILFSLLLTVEILSSVKRNYRKVQFQCYHWSSLLIEAIKRTPGLAFSQHLPERSLAHLFCIVGLLFLNNVLSANFRTSVIVTSGEKLPDTLRDIVNLDFTPYFFQGESMFDTFRMGLIADYRDVYSLAREKSTAYPIVLGEPDSISVSGPGASVITSMRLSRTGIVLSKTLGNKFIPLAYFSQPYHRSLQAILINPINKPQEFSEKFNSRVLTLFESGVTQKLVPKTYDEVLINSGFGITQFAIDVSDLERKSNQQYSLIKPLTLSGFKMIFIIWSIGLVSVFPIAILSRLCQSII